MKTYTEHNPLLKKVGENIESFRLQKKKTVKEVASILELSDTGYRNIERGITEITLTKIFTIANILGIHFSQLINIAEDTAPHNANTEITKKVEEGYKLRLQQYKDENSFLKKQISVLEELILHQNQYRSIAS